MLIATIIEGAGYGHWSWRINNGDGVSITNQMPFRSEKETRENLLNTIAAMKNGVDKIEVEHYKWLR